MFYESGTISFIVKPLRKAALHSGWGRKAAEKIKRWLLALFRENLKHIICLKNRNYSLRICWQPTSN